jgi:hypothetical protein
MPSTGDRRIARARAVLVATGVGLPETVGTSSIDDATVNVV